MLNTIQRLLPEIFLYDLLPYLDEGTLSPNSGIVQLRASNRLFYILINTFLEKYYTIKKISCMRTNIYLLQQNGDLYILRSTRQLKHTYNDLLLNHLPPINKFIKIFQNVKDFIINSKWLILTTNDNRFYACGNSYYLGLSHQQSQIKEFQEILTSFKIKEIAATLQSMVWLDLQGNVYKNNLFLNFNLMHEINNLEIIDGKSYIKIYSNVDKIFTTDPCVMMLSGDSLYAYGANFNQALSLEEPERMFINPPCRIKYILNPQLLQKIKFYLGGFLALYQNKELHYYKNQPKEIHKLIEKNVDKFFVSLDEHMENNVILILKQNGDLIMLGTDEHLLTRRFDLTFMFKSMCLLFFIILLETFNTANHDWLGAKCIEYLSKLISNNVSDLSIDSVISNIFNANSSNQVTPRTPIIHIERKQLIFSKNHGKNLYKMEYNCLCPDPTNQHLTSSQKNKPNTTIEIFEELPIKNKLLQGKAITYKFN